MKTRLTFKLISLALLLTATASGQRSVMVNSNNGTVVYPTNLWTVNAAAARSGLGLSAVATNPVVPLTNGGTGATNANVARTNLSLGWTALTNSNSATSLLGFTTNGQVVSGTNVLTFSNDVKFGGGDLTVSGAVISGAGVSFSFEDGALSGPVTLETNSSIAFQGVSAATTRTNLGLGWAATNAAATRTNLGFSANLNTLWTATNSSNARSAVGLGATNDVTLQNLTLGSQRMTNSGGYYNILTMLESANGSTACGFMGNASTNVNERFVGFFVDGTTEPIWGVQSQTLKLGRSNSLAVMFQSPLTFNNATNAATTRTNLGLPLAALTNTNVTNFRTAVGLGETNTVTFGQFNVTSWISTPYIEANALFIPDGGGIEFEDGGTINFNNAAGSVRASLGLPLAALTNTSNVTAMRALSGSTNTNTPFSGSVSLTNTNTLVFSNGILQSIQ